jgi:hypothetical protein
MSVIRGNAASIVTASLKYMPDNTPCRDAYSKSGFTLSEELDGKRLYLLAAEEICEAPADISIGA